MPRETLAEQLARLAQLALKADRQGQMVSVFEVGEIVTIRFQKPDAQPARRVRTSGARDDSAV